MMIPVRWTTAALVLGLGAVATSAVRQARNSAVFLEGAEARLGFPIDVISGQEEARFIYQGVAHFEHFPDSRLVMDIGGGSTEFAIGQDFQPLKLASRPAASNTTRLLIEGMRWRSVSINPPYHLDETFPALQPEMIGLALAQINGGH